MVTWEALLSNIYAIITNGGTGSSSFEPSADRRADTSFSRDVLGLSLGRRRISAGLCQSGRDVVNGTTSIQSPSRLVYAEKINRLLLPVDSTSRSSRMMKASRPQNKKHRRKLPGCRFILPAFGHADGFY